MPTERRRRFGRRNGDGARAIRRTWLQRPRHSGQSGSGAPNCDPSSCLPAWAPSGGAWADNCSRANRSSARRRRRSTRYSVSSPASPFWTKCARTKAVRGSKRRASRNPRISSCKSALAELLRSWGVYPAAVVGHSVGEVSAAYVSGALSLEDAVAVSYHRSRLQQLAAGKGRMLATGLNQRAGRAPPGVPIRIQFQSRRSTAFRRSRWLAMAKRWRQSPSGSPRTRYSIDSSMSKSPITAHRWRR